MKDISKTIEYKNKEYRLVFNLNVMQAVQEKYGTIEKWGDLTDGTINGEPNAEAVIFGFTEMLNEGIDIDNEEKGENTPALTTKQVGRMITEIGFENATDALTNTVIESTQSTEKNE